MLANPEIITKFIKRNKCWSCKRKFAQPLLLPVKTTEPGKLQPNINSEILHHQYDTHGIEPDILRQWITGAVYGMELTEMGIRK